MKATGKTLSLRGTLSKKLDGQFTTDGQVILEYANVLDLKKAWKVDYYSTWLQDYRNGGQSNDLSSLSIESFLATDSNIVDSANVKIANSPQDNRQIAWGNVMTFLGNGDKVNTTNVQSTWNQHYWIDPDHLVQNELRLFLRLGGTDVREGEDFNVNYIVYLREYEITPEESIIQNVKSKAQDLSN